MLKRKSSILISVVLSVLFIFVLTHSAVSEESPLPFSKFCHQYLSSMTKQPGMAHVKLTTDIVKVTSDKYSITVTLSEDSVEKETTIQSITGYLFDGNEATGKFELPGGFTAEAGQEITLDTFAIAAPDEYWIGLEVSCADGQVFRYIRQLPADSDTIAVVSAEVSIEDSQATDNVDANSGLADDE